MYLPLPPSVGIIAIYRDRRVPLLKIVADPLNQSVNKTIMTLHDKLNEYDSISKHPTTIDRKPPVLYMAPKEKK